MRATIVNVDACRIACPLHPYRHVVYVDRDEGSYLCHGGDRGHYLDAPDEASIDKTSGRMMID